MDDSGERIVIYGYSDVLSHLSHFKLPGARSGEEYSIRRTLVHFQLTQFGLIGLLNGLIDLGALNLLLWLWPTTATLGLFVINSFAYLLAVLNSYFWNSRFTFRTDAFLNSREKLKFVLQAAISFLISNGVFLLCVQVFNRFPLPLWIDQNAAKGLSMAISSTSSFFFMKYYVFHRRESRA